MKVCAVIYMKQRASICLSILISGEPMLMKLENTATQGGTEYEDHTFVTSLEIIAK